MTEADEALIWARGQNGDPAKPRTITDNYRAGLMAHGYRAGQAASAERIKALEGALTPSAGTKYAYLGEFRQARGSRKVTIEWTTIKEIMQAIRDHADALLKEADQ
jgi:hypothetical protein